MPGDHSTYIMSSCSYVSESTQLVNVAWRERMVRMLLSRWSPVVSRHNYNFSMALHQCGSAFYCTFAVIHALIRPSLPAPLSCPSQFPALLIQPLRISLTRRRKGSLPGGGGGGGWGRGQGGERGRCRREGENKRFWRRGKVGRLQAVAGHRGKRWRESDRSEGRGVKWNCQHIKHTLIPSACTFTG